MVNNLPTRDAPPEGHQDGAQNHLECDTSFPGGGENATGRDFPAEELSTSSSPEHQQWYTSVNTSGTEAIPPQARETAAGSIESTGFPFHTITPFTPLYDQGNVQPATGDPRHDRLHEVAGSSWAEVSHASNSLALLSGSPLVFPHVAPHIRPPNDSDVYPSSGRPLDPPQADPGSQTPLPPSNSSTLTFGPPIGTSNNYGFPTGYNEGGGFRGHNREHSESFASTPRSHGSGGVSEVLNREHIFPHDAPCYRNDLLGTYPFRSEHLSPARAHNNYPDGTSFIPNPNPLGEGPSRYGGAGASFSNVLLNPHSELDPPNNRYESHHTSLTHGVSIQDDVGPSGSGATSSRDFPENAQRTRNGKRKRDPEEVGGTNRNRPRRKKDAPSERTQHITRRRIKIEQPTYVSGNPQRNWVQQDPIEFFVNGQPGVRVEDALDAGFQGPDGMEDEMFLYDGAGSSVSCRIRFPGHPAQTSQITTVNHKKTHDPRTRKKLAIEVAKRIKRDVEKLEIDMSYKDMVFTKLIHVSKASWQPEIWYEQDSGGDS